MSYQYILLSDKMCICYPRPASIHAGMKRQVHFQKQFGEEYEQCIVSPELWEQLKREFKVQILEIQTSKQKDTNGNM